MTETAVGTRSRLPMVATRLEPTTKLPPSSAVGAERSAFARLDWAVVTLILVCGLVFNEFPTPTSLGGFQAQPSIFYRQFVGGFAAADMVILIVGVYAFTRRCRGTYAPLSRIGAVATWSIALAIVAGIWVGRGHGSHHSFGDWKNLFLGGVYAFFLWTTVMTSERASRRYVHIFVFLSAAYAAALLLQYAAGGGAVTADLGRTPVFNNPTLEYFVAAVLLSINAWIAGEKARVYRLGALLPGVVILLAFRRFAWLEIAIGVLVTLVGSAAFSGSRKRLRRLAAVLLPIVLILVLVSAFTPSGTRYVGRLSSFYLFSTSTSANGSTYADTNQSHLADILDAWDEVGAHPYFGIGVGSVYPGSRTYQWKTVSGYVHNGPLMVWLKFGLIGLAVYLASYMVLVKRLLGRLRHALRTNGSDAVVLGVLAFVIAETVVSVTVFGWPFEGWEKSMLFFGLVAAAFPRGWERERLDGT